MAPKVLALDLERTLIDDALRCRPRPGLHAFLAFCDERFERVAIFTTVEEAEAREVIEGLALRDYLSSRLLARLEHVDWCGEYKDLRFEPNATLDDVVLVDDDAGWIRPDQRDRWVPIEAWDGGHDDELSRVRSVLEGLLQGRALRDGGPSG